MTRAAPVHPLELISAEIDGEITPGETRFLEAHLRACASCQKKRAELASIATGSHGLPVGAPPAGALDRLLARLHEQKHPVLLLPPAPVPVPEQPPQAGRPRRRARWIALASAAVTLVVVLLGFRAGVPTDRSGVASSVSTPSKAPVAAVERTAPVVPAPAAPVPAVAEMEIARPAQPAPRPATELVRPALAESRRPEPDEGRVTLPVIQFKGNSKRLSREARQLVASVAELLRRHEDVKLTIRGHADERRSVEKNLALAEKRAHAVAQHLESLGIDPSRLQPAPSGNGGNRVEFALKR